jgi:hypothetical protein
MTREKRREKFGFYCSVYRYADKNACTPKSTREADLQEALFECISREIALVSDINGMIADLLKRDSHKLSQKAIDNQINEMQGVLAKNQRFRGSLREDLKDGIVSESDYIMMKNDYDAERDELQAKLNTLVFEKSKYETLISPENKWIKEFRRFEAEKQLSLEILSALVERIDIYDDKRIAITLRYRNEYEAVRAYLTGYEHSDYGQEARAV